MPTETELALAALERIRVDPVWFVREVLGLDPWSKQCSILESVRDNKRTAVRSGHGVGKTTIAAAVVLWFLAAFGPEALAVTTAPTWRQVRDLLWRAIATQHAKAAGFFDGKLNDTRLEFAPEWYAVGLSTREPENFQGYHAPNLLFVCDEASGVAQPIFDAAEGFLTGEGSRVLLIGNPTQVTGQFYDAFHKEQALWHTIHVATTDSPNFTGEEVSERARRALVGQEWLDDKKVKWGEASPIYAVRVKGDFPQQSDRAVVSLAELELAQNRGEEPEAGTEHDWPCVVSCDPARFGSDETVIALRRGNHVRVVKTYNGKATTETTGEILRILRENHHPLYGRPVAVVDEIGIGGGIVDQLRADGEYSIYAYNASHAPVESNEGEYPNARSELWFEFANDWLPVIDLDPDDQLAADLLAPEYKIDAKGRLVVEPKDDTKKRLGRSPDRADGVMMAFSRVVQSGNAMVMPIGLTKPGGSRWR